MALMARVNYVGMVGSCGLCGGLVVVVMVVEDRESVPRHGAPIGAGSLTLNGPFDRLGGCDESVRDLLQEKRP